MLSSSESCKEEWRSWFIIVIYHFQTKDRETSEEDDRSCDTVKILGNMIEYSKKKEYTHKIVGSTEFSLIYIAKDVSY